MRKLRPGDVWWCYFPLREAPDVPAATYHPALVLRLVPSPSGVVKALVAFGGSQANTALTVYQVPVQLPKQNRITIFDLSRRAALPLTAAYFPKTSAIAVLPRRYVPDIEEAFRRAIAAERAEQK